MKRMLFNATHPEELRVAVVEGQKLLDLDIESAIRAQKKGNIYKARVTRVEPSLEAAFVEYGAERQGFLPMKEISRSYFTNYSPSTPMAQVKIQDVIKEGQELLVQVEKDERGTKGAALTTFISLAGRFIVLMPNNLKGGGISRRIAGDERAELRDVMNQLELAPEHALIARTAGIGRSVEEMQWDVDYLMQLWTAIDNASKERIAPFLVFQDSNLVVRTIRDYLRDDVSEIVIDDEQIYARASKFMQQVMPHSINKLKRYEDAVPLFSRFQIEHQIESAFSREVKLPSGGAIVIDHTEAVVTVDVNSARATKGTDIEDTALQTNLEAVEEIARQLRIRDLGGLIVMDLIDMTLPKNQRTVESQLNESLRTDRARVQVGRISRFGLLEMSRQRLRSSIGESNYHVCPHCDGTGQIRSVTSFSLSILRILEEEALKENTEAIHAHLPVEVATFLLNEKRFELSLIEKRTGTNMIVVPEPDLVSPNMHIKRLRTEDMDDTTPRPSYKIEMEEKQQHKDYKKPAAPVGVSEVAAVTPGMLKAQMPPPAPVAPVSAAVATSGGKGMFAKIVAFFTGGKTAQTETVVKEKTADQAVGNQRGNRGDQNNRGGRGGRSGQNNRGGQRTHNNRRAGGNDSAQTKSGQSLRAPNLLLRNSGTQTKNDQNEGGQNNNLKHGDQRSAAADKNRNQETKQNNPQNNAPKNSGNSLGSNQNNTEGDGGRRRLRGGRRRGGGQGARNQPQNVSNNRDGQTANRGNEEDRAAISDNVGNVVPSTSRPDSHEVDGNRVDNGENISGSHGAGASPAQSPSSSAPPPPMPPAAPVTTAPVAKVSGSTDG
ncbi:MAG: Rne/Rng family ribonuclease [Arenicellales bacterium WSBS_2016_MAG_OTU3]